MKNKDTDSLGECLKKARESRKVSIEELSKKTKLSPELLLAIEENRLSAFSQPEFIPGYIRLYARQLGIEEGEALSWHKVSEQNSRRANNNPQQTNLFLDYNPPIHSAEQTTGIADGKSKKIFKHTVLVLFTILFVSMFFYLPSEYKGPKETRSATSRTAETKKDTIMTFSLEGKSSKAVGIKVIGNSDSKRYHLPGMKYYDKVAAYHRVVFNSEDEAIRAGYHKAPR